MSSASYNRVILMGNLTRNPEMRDVPSSSNSVICEFGIAVSRRYVVNGQEREDTCFVDISTWGKLAEICNRYLQKGSPVLIEGRLTYDSWTDKETQKKRSRLSVTADNVQFLPTNQRNDGQGGQGGQGGYNGGQGNQGGYGNRGGQGGYGNGNGGYGNGGYNNGGQGGYQGGYNNGGQGGYNGGYNNAGEQARNDDGPMENVDDIPF